MKKGNNLQKSFSDMNCIWMTSELVKYKLCDKEFDCENCEFDRVFRNMSAKIDDKNPAVDYPNTDILERLIRRIENVKYDNKVIYLKNQLVMKNLFGNAYYLGINPIVLYLIDDFSAIHEFGNNDIKKDQIIFTFEGSWGIKQFISPANFMIIEKINYLQSKFNQWYAIILFNPKDDEQFTISRDEWAQQKDELILSLNSYADNSINIGQTMMDGGEKITHLHQYLGKKEYVTLLNSTFNK